jgi:hypothetical protein
LGLKAAGLRTPDVALSMVWAIWSRLGAQDVGDSVDMPAIVSRPGCKKGRGKKSKIIQDMVDGDWEEMNLARVVLVCRDPCRLKPPGNYYAVGG